MWTVHIPARLLEAHLISSHVNACSISQCFRIKESVRLWTGYLVESSATADTSLIIQFVGPILLWLHFFSVLHTRSSVPKPLTHRQWWSSVVDSVFSFKVFPYSISGVTDVFFFMISEYTVYSMCFCCFCGQQLSCNSDAFDWCFHSRGSFNYMDSVNSVIIYKTTLRRAAAAGSLCNWCPCSKIVQLNKKSNITKLEIMYN